MMALSGGKRVGRRGRGREGVGMFFVKEMSDDEKNSV